MEVKETPKGIKCQKMLDPEDRISLLPDSLIIDEILSRLDSTKETIKTGTLSKRWRHLWPSVSFLRFDDFLYFKKHSPVDQYRVSSPEFYQSVDKTLTQCRPRLKKLNKFNVSTAYDNRFESHVNNWIRFATGCKVQRLYLDLRYKEDIEDEFVLEGDSFFINSHFTHLQLEGCIFNPSGQISWNNLTDLSISHGKLDQDLVTNILSGSPLLETLSLFSCYGFSRLIITSKSVKTLTFDGYAGHDDDFNDLDQTFEINAPYLSSLIIMDYLLLCKFLLRDVSSLVELHLCHINYDMRFKSHVKDWIHFATSGKVKELKVCLRCKEETEDEFVLEGDSFFINSHFTDLDLGLCKFNPTGPITWNNLTDLNVYYGKLDEDLIANILSGCPLLETLTLDKCYGYSCLDIASKSVKNLVLCGYADLDDESGNCDQIIEINAPYISSLKITGTLFIWKILLRDVSSLVKAVLDYTKLGYFEVTRKEEREEMLEMFILRLHHVKELKVGISCYTTFSRLEAKGFIFPSNLKVVEVTDPVYDSDDSTELDSDDSTELVDRSDDDSSVCESSGFDLLSIAGTLGPVQATQRVILSQLAALLYDYQRYQPLLERLAQEDARAAGVALATYAPPQVLMPASSDDSTELDGDHSMEVVDRSVNDSSVRDSSGLDLQSIAATLGPVQATQRVILSQLSGLLYDNQRYQPLLERLAQEDARAAGVELSTYAPPQVLMPANSDDSTELDGDHLMELVDRSLNDSSVSDSSGLDLQSVAATLGPVQATQRVILSQLSALLYDNQRYQPLLERLAQEDARAAGVELATYAPPQVMMPDDDQDAVREV